MSAVMRFRGDRRLYDTRFFLRIIGGIWQSHVISYRFLEERGDQQRIVNHISKELSKIKTPQHSTALSASPLCVSIML